MDPESENIDDRWQIIRKHPDFSFGTLFVKRDWPDGKQPIGVDIEGIERDLMNEGFRHIDEHMEDPSASRGQAVHRTPAERSTRGDADVEPDR